MASMPTTAGEVSGSALAGLSIRIDLEGGCRIGPGKVRLLELIEATGSISAAVGPWRCPVAAPGSWSRA